MVSFFADNLGRKKSMVIGWGITTVGTILLALSTNLWMAGAGLFMAGLGSDSSINICYNFLGEVV